MKRFFWLPTILTIGDGILKFFRYSLFLDIAKLGLQSEIVWIGIVELVCLIIFLTPRFLLLGFFFICCFWGGLIVADFLALNFDFFPVLMLILFAVAAYFLDSPKILSSHHDNVTP
ncbi:MAG TPA: hypothetical protein PLK82_00560 [Bacteroidales bacterium]|nr:hypothetical protein [Bacteroidales bacterium]